MITKAGLWHIKNTSWSIFSYPLRILKTYVKSPLNLRVSSVVNPSIFTLYNRFDNQLYTRYSQLSNRLSNGFDNRLKNTDRLPRSHDTSSLSNRPPVECSTGWMFVYTIQQLLHSSTIWTTGCIVQTNIQLNWFLVLQTVWQPVISCISDGVSRLGIWCRNRVPDFASVNGDRINRSRRTLAWKYTPQFQSPDVIKVQAKGY